MRDPKISQHRPKAWDDNTRYPAHLRGFASAMKVSHTYFYNLGVHLKFLQIYATPSGRRLI